MENQNEFIGYAKHIEADEYVINWVKTTLKNYLETNKAPTEEVEHILDCLVLSGKRVSKMSYSDAKKLADSWIKSQQKKGNGIIEKPEDTEIVLDFKDGFKIVKLIGENAYKREGFLMSHCVASYYGRDVEIYSLRDKDNMPHATMEKERQIKGKGNGDIHPKYVGYIVKFLEHVGMTVGDSEMKHLGYVNIESIIPDISDETKKKLYAKKYYPANEKEEIKDKNGNKMQNLSMLDFFPLIEEADESIKVAWDISLFVQGSLEWIRKKVKTAKKNDEVQAGGSFSKLAGGSCSQLAGGSFSQLVGGSCSQLAGGICSKLVGGDCSQLAGGSFSKLAGGSCSQLAGGICSKLVIGKNSVAVGDHDSKAKGKMGAVIVLVKRDSKGDIIDFVAGQIDGKKLKEDTWYILKNKKFQEAK